MPTKTKAQEEKIAYESKKMYFARRLDLTDIDDSEDPEDVRFLDLLIEIKEKILKNPDICLTNQIDVVVRENEKDLLYIYTDDNNAIVFNFPNETEPNIFLVPFKEFLVENVTKFDEQEKPYIGQQLIIEEIMDVFHHNWQAKDHNVESCSYFDFNALHGLIEMYNSYIITMQNSKPMERYNELITPIETYVEDKLSEKPKIHGIEKDNLIDEIFNVFTELNKECKNHNIPLLFKKLDKKDIPYLCFLTNQSLSKDDQFVYWYNNQHLEVKHLDPQKYSGKMTDFICPECGKFFQYPVEMVEDSYKKDGTYFAKCCNKDLTPMYYKTKEISFERGLQVV